DDRASWHRPAGPDAADAPSPSGLTGSVGPVVRLCDENGNRTPVAVFHWRVAQCPGGYRLFRRKVTRPWDSLTQIATACALADSGMSASFSGALPGTFERSDHTQA